MKLANGGNPTIPLKPESGPPTAEAYAGRKIKSPKSRLDKLKMHEKPVGGAPPIPPGKLRALQQVAGPLPGIPFEIPPDVMAQQQRQQMPGQLPPAGIPGVGSAYAANQELARGGAIPTPMSQMAAAEQRRKTKGSISPETAELISKTMAGQQEQPPAQDEEAVEDLNAADEEILSPGIPPTILDFEAIAEARTRLMSQERREAIEANLEPMDLSDLVTKGELKQVIPIVPGKFSITLRTANHYENLFCLDEVYKNQTASLRYVQELHETYKLVCHLVSLNGAHYPDHRKNVGKVDEAVDPAMFAAKLRAIEKTPIPIIADIGIQATWFNDRVLELFIVKNLKNG